MRINSEFSEYILKERCAGSFNHYVGPEPASKDYLSKSKVARVPDRKEMGLPFYL
jgi:hypothetical protein